MNIICVVPSLDVKDNNIYLKLKALLGDSLIRDISVRNTQIETKGVNIRFVCCEQDPRTISGLLIDIAIIDDKNITAEWVDFLVSKVTANNGIIMSTEF